MPITIQLDVTKLSREDAQKLLLEMLDKNVINLDLLNSIMDHLSDNDSKKRQDRIKEIVDKHFDKYEDVFKTLA